MEVTLPLAGLVVLDFSQFLAGHLEFPLLAAGIPPKEIKFPLSPAHEQIAFEKLKDVAPDTFYTVTEGRGITGRKRPPGR